MQPAQAQCPLRLDQQLAKVMIKKDITSAIQLADCHPHKPAITKNETSLEGLGEVLNIFFSTALASVEFIYVNIKHKLLTILFPC